MVDQEPLFPTFSSKAAQLLQGIYTLVECGCITFNHVLLDLENQSFENNFGYLSSPIYVLCFLCTDSGVKNLQ